MFARSRSDDYGTANGHTALAEHQNIPDLFLTVEDHQNVYPVYDYLAVVADYKDIQSLTHLEDCVEDSRTADLAWLTQDQD